MSYMTKDEQLVYRLQKHSKQLSIYYPRIAHLSEKELEACAEASHVVLTVMQMYEIADKIDDLDVRDMFRHLRTKQVKMFRNIVAHDYDSFNWKIGKVTCKQIIEKTDDDLFRRAMEMISINKAEMKDYTLDN